MKLRGRSSMRRRRRRRHVWGQQRSRPACSHQRGKLLAPQSATCVPLHGDLVGNPGRIWAYQLFRGRGCESWSSDWRFQIALSGVVPVGMSFLVFLVIFFFFFNLHCGDEPLQQKKKKNVFFLTSCVENKHQEHGLRGYESCILLNFQASSKNIKESSYSIALIQIKLQRASKYFSISGSIWLTPVDTMRPATSRHAQRAVSTSDTWVDIKHYPWDESRTSFVQLEVNFGLIYWQGRPECIMLN